MLKCPSAVWGEHIYILFLFVGWGGLITAISVFYAVVAIKRETRHYSRVSSMPWMLRSPCVCGRRTSSEAIWSEAYSLTATAKCILPYRVIKACVSISILWAFPRYNSGRAVVNSASCGVFALRASIPNATRVYAKVIIKASIKSIRSSMSISLYVNHMIVS